MNSCVSASSAAIALAGGRWRAIHSQGALHRVAQVCPKDWFSALSLLKLTQRRGDRVIGCSWNYRASVPEEQRFWNMGTWRSQTNRKYRKALLTWPRGSTSDPLQGGSLCPGVHSSGMSLHFLPSLAGAGTKCAQGRASCREINFITLICPFTALAADHKRSLISWTIMGSATHRCYRGQNEMNGGHLINTAGNGMWMLVSFFFFFLY